MKTRIYYLYNKKKNQVISLNRLEDMIKYPHRVIFCFLRQKTKLVNIFRVSSHDHIF